MKHKLASTLIYLMTAGYFVASLYILIFTASDDSIGFLQAISHAWSTPEYEDVFVLGIASIFINVFIAVILFVFFGRTKGLNYCLTTIVWILVLVAWAFTPGLLENYVLGAVLVTIFSSQNLTSLGIGRS
jgi:hypothetical protein